MIDIEELSALEANVIKALGGSPARLYDLLKNKERFEGWFGIEWPNATPDEVVSALRHLSQEGLVDSNRRLGSLEAQSTQSTLIWLTRRGGKVWDRGFNVCYGELCWFDFTQDNNFQVDGLFKYDLITRSLSRKLSVKTAELMSQSVSCCDIIGRKTFRKMSWSYCYWRRFRYYYETRITMFSKIQGVDIDTLDVSFIAAWNDIKNWRSYEWNKPRDGGTVGRNNIAPH